MQKFLTAAAAAVLLLGAVGAAQAAPDGKDMTGDHHRVMHPEWSKGHKIDADSWRRGQVVDWRSHHLSAPPRGYEWREIDGNWVLAAVATGVIVSVLEAH
ncbi:MAG TPA: RcnB family protein [Caulobacteraceae bacterium]|jgi:Ni/Co efflux regulator RcnB